MLEVNLAPMSLDVPSAGAARSALAIDFASILERWELSATEFDFGLWFGLGKVTIIRPTAPRLTPLGVARGKTAAEPDGSSKATNS